MGTLRLNTIKLSNETKNFIPYIKMNSTTTKLTGSASQLKRLVLILPLALYDRIKDPYDEVWKLLFLLREICCIVSSPALTIQRQYHMSPRMLLFAIDNIQKI
ncbi:hypothetical protein TSAR_015936 [Trichomalopsis sarcophagae]|uniref:Uncharacterized protein n=1 Tax=Trichomalopsis sarcophagae TaxID=543379 RepID=A0A232F067_9HYME|nr:hypothetical protein TSAR_015936 [Trichomalopsis sarcophagae]